MKKVSLKNLKFVPASHEDKKDPGVIKKVVFRLEDFSPGINIQMVNFAKLSRGKEFKTHYHTDMEEVFIILKGKAKIIINGEEEVLKKKEAVIIPAGKSHKMINTGESEVEYIVLGVSLRKRGKTIVLEDEV